MRGDKQALSTGARAGIVEALGDAAPPHHEALSIAQTTFDDGKTVSEEFPRAFNLSKVPAELLDEEQDGENHHRQRKLRHGGEGSTSSATNGTAPTAAEACAQTGLYCSTAHWKYQNWAIIELNPAPSWDPPFGVVAPPDPDFEVWPEGLAAMVLADALRVHDKRMLESETLTKGKLSEGNADFLPDA